jgi:hypothetical protein
MKQANQLRVSENKYQQTAAIVSNLILNIFKQCL